MCETTSDRLGTYTKYSAAIRDYQKYRILFNKYRDGDIKAGEDLTNCGFKLLLSILWGLPPSRLTETRHFTCCLLRNIQDPPHEVDYWISEEVQEDANFGYCLKEFTDLSWLFTIQ